MFAVAKDGKAWCRRCRWPALVLAASLVAYLGGYAALYHRGVAEADAIGMPYFFYVPLADVARQRGVPDQHALLVRVYEPLNRVHQRWFGGRSACHGITLALGLE
jgi:hypothetical protein